MIISLCMKDYCKKKKRRFSRCHLKKQYKKNVRTSVVNEILLLSRKDIDDMVNYIPLLSNEDVLFTESDAVSDAILNTTQSGNDVLIPNGYISTSVLLLNIIKFSQSNLVKDSYIFPALFCFRQYLEIIMKGAILRYRNGDINPYQGESNFKTHDLEELWSKLIKHIQVDEDVDNIGRIIHELNEVDNDSTAFRYDYHLNRIVRNKDNRQIKELLDLDVLKQRVLQLYRFFDGIDDDSRVYYDKKL